MKIEFYNVYTAYHKDHTLLFEAIDKLVELGFNNIILTFSREKDLTNENIEEVMRYCSKKGVGFSTRFHISEKIVEDTGKGIRGKILRIRNRVAKKVCIVSVEDTLFKFLTPNDAYKFELIRISDPKFRIVVKLLDKPPLFEFVVDRSTLKENRLWRKLFIIKMLLNKNKLVISQNIYSNTIYSPLHLAYFIYGLVDDVNFSYNVISTLPMELIAKCR